MYTFFICKEFNSCFYFTNMQQIKKNTILDIKIRCSSQYICYDQIKRKLNSEIRKLKFSVLKKTNRNPKVDIVKIVSTFVNKIKVSLKNKMLKKKRPNLRKTMRFMRKSTLERKSKRELLEVCQLWGKQVTELIRVSIQGVPELLPDILGDCS